MPEKERTIKILTTAVVVGLVFQIAEHQAPNQDDFAKQSKDIQQQLLQSKQEAAFAAFRTAIRAAAVCVLSRFAPR